MKLETLLREEVQNELEELGKMELGTDEYKSTVDGIAKLTDKLIEIDKINIEHEEKMSIQVREDEFRFKQMEQDRKDRRLKNGISIGSLLLSGIAIYWTFRFEEKGTIGGMMSRFSISNAANRKN